ncbi:DNA-binding response regulator LuxR family [Dehalogenimonas sp. WBC-2]|nr:DNA-binding response regulator LuxR family [Dehalogenimonas sp. WBC-2]
MDKIKVYLADNHEIFRVGLRAVLRDMPDIEVAGDSDLGPGLLDMIKKDNPDFVLLDVDLGRSDYFNNLDLIKVEFPGIKVVAMSGDERQIPVRDVLSRRIDGYIRKSCSGEFLCTTIQMIGLGGNVWQSDMLYCTLEEDKNPEAAKQSNLLTSVAAQISLRERQILTLLVKGETNKQIGKAMNLAQVTVKKTLQGLFVKLGVTNRTQAAMMATRYKLI